MKEVSEIRLPQKPGYGAAEIKLAIRRNTYRAFLFTMAGLTLVLSLSFFTGKVTSKETNNMTFREIELINVKETEQKEELKRIELPEPETIFKNLNHGPKEVISQILKGVDEEKLDSNPPEIATVEKNNLAGSKPGDGIDSGEMEIEINTAFVPEEHEVAVIDEPPDNQRPEYFSPDVPPSVNLDELRKNIVYPEMARKAGVGGKVIIKVWINEQGMPEEIIILKSESKLLEAEAVRVVRLPVYTPAINNGKPVGCWIVIPIHFKLTE